MSFANKVLFFFPNYILFISLPCFVASFRTSHMMLNRSGTSRHPCLAPVLSRRASSFLMKSGISWRFLLIFFLMLKKFPSISSLWKAITFSIYFFYHFFSLLPCVCLGIALAFFNLLSLFFRLDNF